MTFPLRTFALALAAAHVWVAAMPCAPADGSDAKSGPAPRSMAGVAAASARPDVHEPPAHHDHAAPDAPAPCPGHAAGPARPVASFMPVCPCGCSDRSPTAGASSVRIGVALLPSAEPERPAVHHVEHATLGAPAPLDVTLPGPDAVPRTLSIA